MKSFADFLDVAVCYLASVMNDVSINRIANLSISTSRINLEYTFMCAVLTVRKLCTIVF